LLSQDQSTVSSVTTLHPLAADSQSVIIIYQEDFFREKGSTFSNLKVK